MPEDAIPTTDAPSGRTRVRRLPELGAYDRTTIDAILDAGLVAHLGIVDDGAPIVIPTLYARIDDRLYVHGSAASRTLKTSAGGAPVCVTVTLLDGIVLARSIFEHSINYRSVVVMGVASPVDDPQEKLRALEAFSEQINDGPPDDGESEDGSLDVWAGNIPLVVTSLPPVADPLMRPGLPVPPYAADYRRPGLNAWE